MNIRKRPQIKLSIVLLLLVVLLLIFLSSIKAENLNQPSDLKRDNTSELPDGVEFYLMYSINDQIPTNKPGNVKEGDEVLFYVNVGWDINQPLTNVGVYGDIPTENGKSFELIPGTVSSQGQRINNEMYWRYSYINGFYYITFIYRTKVPHVDSTTIWKNIGRFTWTDSEGTHTFIPDLKDQLVLTQPVYNVSVEIEQRKNGNNFTKDKLYVNTGDNVDYKITITNNSGIPITDMTVTDPVFNALSPKNIDQKENIHLMKLLMMNMD